MDAEAANAARCTGRPGTYEAWYLTIADPSRRRGFWLRYTTLNPAAGVPADPQSALWAFSFDHDEPSANWGGKATFPLDALQASARPFGLRLQSALLSQDGCSGEVLTGRGKAAWDLRWTSREPPFPFLAPRWQSLSSVANIGAQPALTVSGTIEIDGRTHRLDNAPGGQQHTWGSSHALSWNWGFASGRDFWIDGATSRVRSRFGRVLVGTAVGAKAAGHRFLFNGPLQVLRNRGPISADRWIVEARLGKRVLSVTVKPRREDLIGVKYTDPQGDARYCYHTEVADLELRLTRGGETLAQVSQPAGAAFEFASDQPLPGLPPLL